MALEQRALWIDCEGERLLGVLHLPGLAAAAPTRAVLIVVGGLQYRAGSHRQFTLLARALAASGLAALRFDCRGMGDSEGAPRDFTDTGPDLRSAIDALFAQVPSLREVVLWGLCDGASAAMLYAPGDARVSGLALLNPWARSEAGLARATLKTYYRGRLFDPGLWKKIASGRFSPRAALASLAGVLRRALAAPESAEETLGERLRGALERFGGPLLLMTCDADLTAQEFMGVASEPGWQKLLQGGRTEHRRLPEADHTCSSAPWRAQVEAWTADWAGRLPPR